MKTTLFFLLLFFLCTNSYSQIAGYSDFEIVESTPVGTNLANPDIRKAHDVWLEMINGAKNTLDLEEFYISNKSGEPLEDILQAIIAAGKRGVHVRCIADAKMYKTYPEMVDSLGRQKNITSRVIDFGKLTKGVEHAKYFIVDGEQIFMGSQNFDWRSLKHIHELGLRIKHKEAVKIYRDIFDLDWKLAEKNDPNEINRLLKLQTYSIPFNIIEGTNDTVTFFPTMSPIGLICDSTLWDETNIVNLIDGANSDLFCQFLTYSPSNRDKSFYPVLDGALRRAAARGVKVKMIVADWSKERFTVEELKKLSQVPNIEIKFSVIPEWSGGYIPFARVEHCKYIVADKGRFWLGTSNGEKGYFYNLRNLGMIVKNMKLTSILRNVFLKSWDGNYTEPVKNDVEYTPRRHGEK
jgi:phosphatidylserine/phosphatidylglycerophosphate/cardiolipin synthase-like enzyme